jgi:GAF domain-containing protein
MADDTGDQAHIAEMFAEVARQLLDERDVQATLNRIVRLAQANLDHAESVGVSIVKGRKIESPASSNAMAMQLDKLQQEVDEGPCLEALRDHQVFLIGDLQAESRWPLFCRRAHAETGVLSMMSVRLFAQADTLGAMNVYSTKVNAFDEVGVAMATVFATHAAVALTHANREEQLERKAASRELIGRAKGILMAQNHVTDEKAFELLREASQRLNLKVSEIADRVAHTGDLPAAK